MVIAALSTARTRALGRIRMQQRCCVTWAVLYVYGGFREGPDRRSLERPAGIESLTLVWKASEYFTIHLLFDIVGSFVRGMYGG
jgi:hypothetical protein